MRSTTAGSRFNLIRSSWMAFDMSRFLFLAVMFTCSLVKPAVSEDQFIERAEIALSEIGEAVLAGEGYASSVEETILDPTMHSRIIELLTEANSREHENIDKARYHALEREAFTILSKNYQNLFEIYLAESAEPSDGERRISCSLDINGTRYIGGQCFFRSQGDGSFQISSIDRKYFAQLFIEREGVGSLHWNAEPFANHAHSRLGFALRDGACWESHNAKVCAY